MLHAFHNDPKVKTKYLDRVMAHYKADEIIKGIYWDNGKGCAVGCTIHGSRHKDYEKELGIPEGLAILEDNIFESLQNGKAKEWPVKFLKSIKVGANLELAGWKFNFWLQTENLKFAKKQKMPTEVIEAIKQVIAYLKPVAEGKPIDEKARSAAWSAARSAAWSAAESAA